MTKPPTLNELKQLEKSGFGKPYPRHGLKLLYWFAHDCLNDYKKIHPQNDPKTGTFGFHHFLNRIDKNGVKLLPDGNHKYYEVGNLRTAGADKLPDYVREDYIQNCNNPDSNMDRIIVSVVGECFDRVYVTEHSDQTDFNKEATYCISRDLIMHIRKLTLENFLTETGYRTLRTNTDQGTGSSTLRNVSDDLKTECSIQIQDFSLLDNNENRNRCRCIIL